MILLLWMLKEAVLVYLEPQGKAMLRAQRLSQPHATLKFSGWSSVCQPKEPNTPYVIDVVYHARDPYDIEGIFLI